MMAYGLRGGWLAIAWARRYRWVLVLAIRGGPVRGRLAGWLVGSDVQLDLAWQADRRRVMGMVSCCVGMLVQSVSTSAIERQGI